MLDKQIIVVYAGRENAQLCHVVRATTCNRAYHEYYPGHDEYISTTVYVAELGEEYREACHAEARYRQQKNQRQNRDPFGDITNPYTSAGMPRLPKRSHGTR